MKDDLTLGSDFFLFNKSYVKVSYLLWTFREKKPIRLIYGLIMYKIILSSQIKYININYRSK